MYNRYGQQTVYATLTPVAGGLAFCSSFDKALVEAFKLKIPSSGRRWDGTGKRWIVSAQYGRACAELAETFLGVKLTVPAQTHLAATIETRLLKVEYLGRTKDRGAGDSSASAWVDGGWGVIFPEDVLRLWFEALPQSPGEKPTLYAVLAVKSAATADEIKSAFRRLAKQWHPDVNRNDPDAGEQFKVINHAYEILSSELTRRKYDAGLALEASMKQQTLNSRQVYNAASYLDADGYRSPLRCGWVLCEGQESLGRFTVSKILQFEDILDSRGRTMVVSWPAGATTFLAQWQ